MVVRVVFAFVALSLSVTLARAAAAFTVPALVDGHVVDTTGKLSRDDIDALNRQLEATRLQSGYVIDAFVVGSLDGTTIDDVAAQTFQTWKPGDAKKDNGVLIVVAPNDRQDRIEVGNGVEGALTDLQTDDIRRSLIEPRLKQSDFEAPLRQVPMRLPRRSSQPMPGSRRRRTVRASACRASCLAQSFSSS
jgi:uncharacterized protein